MSTPKFDIYAGTYEDGARLDYMIAVMQRYAETEVTECAELTKCNWLSCSKPAWDWRYYNYRIPARHRPKPKMKLVPFTAETVPAEHWFRSKYCEKEHYRAVAINRDAVGFWPKEEVDYARLLVVYQHSADRKTWLPCGVEVPDEGGAE